MQTRRSEFSQFQVNDFQVPGELRRTKRNLCCLTNNLMTRNPHPRSFKGLDQMKTKIFLLSALLAVATALPASAQRRVATTSGGRTVVSNNFSRPFCHGNSVAIGIGFPFYTGYYGFPYYGGSPYYGYNSYPYGGSYYGAPIYGRPFYGSNYRGSTIARVQERLARAGYYSGSIDGIMGPRTRSTIRAYGRRHGLPIDSVIDSRLLARMGLA